MNLRPAPFALTPAIVATLVGDGQAASIVHLPVMGRTVDRPRRSEDPRCAKANDNEGVAHV